MLSDPYGGRIARSETVIPREELARAGPFGWRNLPGACGGFGSSSTSTAAIIGRKIGFG
jgi:hypothetical protein